MKKYIRILLASLMLTAFLGMSAWAAAVDDDFVYSPNGEVVYVPVAGTVEAHYTAVYNSGLTEGGQYALLVVRANFGASGPSASTLSTATYSVGEDTIMYIDQEASATGVSFDFIPKSAPDSLVLLAGDGLAEPVRLGAIKSQGVEVTGTVGYQPSRLHGAVVELKKGSEVISTTTTDITTGEYSFASVPVDSGYTLFVTKPNYCSYTMTDIDIAEDGVLPTVDITMLAGDANGNGVINGYDIPILLNQFNLAGNLITDTRADINSNDEVNGYDLSYILTNFNNENVSVVAG